MKALRFLAILLILALSFSTLTACEIISGVLTPTPGGSTDEVGGDVADKPDDGITDDKLPDDEKDNKDDITDGKDPDEEACEHEWIDGTCTKCYSVCRHSWKNGVCEICITVCSHSFSGDTCEICGTVNTENKECTHDWIDGVCSLCGEACEHDFDPKNDYTCTVCGVQALVPPECKHSWTDGVCALCGKVCEHDFGFDITCSICGDLRSGSYILLTYNGTDYEVRYESTLAEFISEHLGTTYEATVANGSYWMALDLNLDKVTLEANTSLSMFGACFELYYIDATPAPECQHEWSDGYCPKCGRSCDHSYTDSICTVCGMACENHYFSGGECIYCGKPCEHVWDNNRCTVCGLDCMHEGNWSEGVCTLCGAICNHQWVIDHCEICGFVCDHTFDGPTCTKCGYTSGGIDNPLCITYNGTDFYTPYSATFHELFYQYADLGYRDYEESLRDGYWVVVTETGDVQINEYTSLCEFGHFMTIAFRTYGTVECQHPYWNYGVCADCGAMCDHKGGYSPEGYCYTCGLECPHRWSENTCLNCGAYCMHDVWQDGVCAKCDKICDHSWQPSGYCNVCEKACVHEFYGDTCSLCGYYQEYTGMTFLLRIQAYPSSNDILEYYIKMDAPFSMARLFDESFVTMDNQVIELGYEERFIFRYNGTALDDNEWKSQIIEDGGDVFIYRGFIYDIEYVTGTETLYHRFKSTSKRCINDILSCVNIYTDSNATATVDGIEYTADDFYNMLFPIYDNELCYVRYDATSIAGTVRLEFYQESMYCGSYEETGELNIASFISSGEEFKDFLWTLEYPNGETVNLETLDTVLTFMPEYLDGGATVYKLYQTWNVFFVSLSMGDTYYDQLKFYKTDNLTVRDILAVFGIYEGFENYDWMFQSFGESISSLDDYVHSDLQIQAYDNRPYVELIVDGIAYKAYHTETVTLADAIDLVNKTNGTSITFEGYIWYAYSNETYRTERVTDPYTFILAEATYSRDATAKTLSEVEVYFVTDFGPINDEIGMNSVTFKKDSEWWTPVIADYILEMAGDYVSFTGGFEYRIEGRNENGQWVIFETGDVNSIDELFAINNETVTLYAKYEVNYEKICGTYVKNDQILVITEKTISKYYVDYGYFGEAKPYRVEISSGQICLYAEDGSFGYYTSYLTEYVKIEDGAFAAVVYNENSGYTDVYLSYDDYLMMLVYCQEVSVTDKDGVYLGEVNSTGLYFVRVTERTDEYLPI